jgi:hypothetical protein
VETALIVVQIVVLMSQLLVMRRMANMLDGMGRHLDVLAEFEKHLWFNQNRTDIFDAPRTYDKSH